jgi:hypothetical protein
MALVSACSDEKSPEADADSALKGAETTPAQVEALPPAPGRPDICEEAGQLRVNWVIPDMSPPVTHSTVRVRAEGENEEWLYYDSVSKRLLTTASASTVVAAPLCSMLFPVSGSVQGRSFEAQVAEKNSAGSSQFSPSSNFVKIQALPGGAFVGQKVESLVAFERSNGEKICKGDIGEVKGRGVDAGDKDKRVEVQFPNMKSVDLLPKVQFKAKVQTEAPRPP